MAQIINITSEALQATIRRLLPSQQGFGEDLQASNVIQPIIDLTSSASATSLPADLQNSLNFGGVTTFNVSGATTTIVSTAGFFRVFATVAIHQTTAGARSANFLLNDGSTDKTIFSAQLPANAGASDQTDIIIPVDFIVFLRSGDSLIAQETIGNGRVKGVTRQIADINGVGVGPVGFTPQ
jgi:hypothetical protein